ncbi:hypothetical protein NSB24_05330 [Blautia coccoides]|uniref:Uncharacterized protein n=2 Tax=Blautia producta TaxID=33035 RepID=A0A7G5N317_9FIRM|nr:hypothetical protein [Blautia producta]MCR1985641.1 hypothetical protein [Blautia coccoides]QIB58650.1 hypothetical protein GXM18_13505 [Blautia producta ATCC 27340 = DSM 2950]QMW81260.1 hypothetical protein E5259_01275 [Blautia producta]
MTDHYDPGVMLSFEVSHNLSNKYSLT